MSGRLNSDGIAYTGATVHPPASDTEISPKPIGILLDATGTCTVRFESGGTQVVLPLAGGVVHPISPYSIDAIATATTVHVLY